MPEDGTSGSPRPASGDGFATEGLRTTESAETSVPPEEASIEQVSEASPQANGKPDEGPGREEEGGVPTERLARLAARSGPLGLVWPAALLLVGVWGTIAPWVAQGFDVEPSLKIIDHLVPGSLTLLAVLFSLYRRARGHPDNDIRALTAAATMLFMGFFMAATHVPLVFQDLGFGTFPRPGVLVHSLPGPLILILGGWRALRLFSAA